VKSIKKPRLEARIVGGQDASPQQFPHQAYVIVTNNLKREFFCSGTLIQPQWILTTASCLKVFSGIKNITIKMGSINADEMPISLTINDVERSVWIHKDYSFPKNNIGLIKLPEEVCISDDVKPIKLPNSQECYNGEIMTVSGFGRDQTGIRSSILQFIDEL
jgi:kallikrein 4